jgi:uncharacterized protein YciI
MFIITLTYVVPLAELDARMTDHVKFLQKYYKESVFLTSGRQVPRTGGIIVAVGKSKAEIEAIMKTDPFCAHGLAGFTVTEFLNSQVHPLFREMMSRLPAPK